MASSGKLYQRFGVYVNARGQIAVADRQKEFVLTPGAGSMAKVGLIRFQSSAALACYIEERPAECVVRAADVVATAIGLFFGACGDSVRDVWVDPFRRSVFWSACLHDWACAQRLSAYPSETTLDTISERKSEAPWYQLLAAYLRGDATERDFAIDLQPIGEPSAKPKSFERLIEEGRSRRLKLLSAVLRAIRDKDAVATQRCLEDYLAYYRKTEFPRPSLEEKVSVDGSILVHLAEQEGLLLEVPTGFADYIVRLPAGASG